MSYAIAPTFEANKIGVRRAYTLGQFRGLGDVNDTAQSMINDGYDPNIVYPLVTYGATDAQLQNLYDHYGAGTPEFNDAANGLLSYLKSQPNIQAPPVNMQTSAAGAAYGAAAAAGSTIINSAWGALDLSGKDAWDFISGQFSTTQQNLNALAQKAPKDPDVVQMVTDFNGTVMQWAGYYQSVFGNAPSPLPMASIPTLSGLGVAPLIIAAGVIAGVAAVLGTLYLLNQRIALKNQALLAQASLTQAQSQSGAVNAGIATGNNFLTQAAALLAHANSLPPSQAAQAAQERAQAAALQQQAATLFGGSLSATSTPQAQAPSALTSWFTQNWMGVAAVLVAVAVLPNLVKKL